MEIKRENDKQALDLIKSNLPAGILSDKNVADLLKRIGTEIESHYCVNYMTYYEDGIYEIPEGTQTFPTKKDALDYIKKNEIDFYYDDETREAVTVNPDGTETRSKDDYLEEDDGPWRIWKA